MRTFSLHCVHFFFGKLMNWKRRQFSRKFLGTLQLCRHHHNHYYVIVQDQKKKWKKKLTTQKFHSNLPLIHFRLSGNNNNLFIKQQLMCIIERMLIVDELHWSPQIREQINQKLFLMTIFVGIRHPGRKGGKKKNLNT